MLTERTSRVQEIMQKIAHYTACANAPKAHTPFNPYEQIKLYKELVPVDKKQLKEKLRTVQKKSWRVSGCGSGQFSPASFIKGKVLNNWEIARMGLSNRSYTTPKDFKGLKFPAPSIDDVPNTSKDYFKKCQQDYWNRQLQTFQTSKTYESKLKRLRQSMRQQFRTTNTKQSRAFGYTTKLNERTKTFPSSLF